MKKLSAWFDEILIDGWRNAHRLWSMRVAAIWVVLSFSYLLLPAFQNSVSGPVYAALSVAMCAALFIARLKKQPGVLV